MEWINLFLYVYAECEQRSHTGARVQQYSLKIKATAITTSFNTCKTSNRLNNVPSSDIPTTNIISMKCRFKESFSFSFLSVCFLISNYWAGINLKRMLSILEEIRRPDHWIWPKLLYTHFNSRLLTLDKSSNNPASKQFFFHIWSRRKR